MQQTELIKLAQELCDGNYCFGFDTFAECFGKSEWSEFFEDYEVTTKANLITALNESASMRSSMAGDRECYYVCETGKCDTENTRDNPKEYCDCNFHPSPDPQELHWQKQERRLNNFHPIPEV